MRALPLVLWLVGAAVPDGGGGTAASDDAPTVSARADRTEARVGDVVTVVVTAIHRRGLAVNLPARLELGKFTVLDKSDDGAARDLGDGRMRREFTLKVAAYEPGELQIPPVEVTYLTPGGEVRELETAALPLKITALLANVDKPELKDNAAPVAVFESVVWPLYAAVTVAALLVMLLGAVALSRRLARRAPAGPPPPARPAHEIALARLDALRAQGLVDRGEWKPLHIALSEILREYLGARYGFDALEMTTTELLHGLREKSVGVAELAFIEPWCAACDLVKFARYTPTHSEAQQTLEGAYQIVDRTRQREAAVALPHEEPRVHAA